MSPKLPNKTLMPRETLERKPCLYIFRDTGKGRPDGTYIKKILEPIETEDQLKEGLPPGQYIIMESGPGNKLRRRPLLVEGKPIETDAQSPENILKSMERIAMIRAYGNLLKPETDPNELLRVLLQNSQRGDVGLFRDGLELGQEVSQQEPPSTETALLAQLAGIFGGGAQQQAPAPGLREIKMLAVQMARRQKSTEDAIQQLAGIVATLSGKVETFLTEKRPEGMREEEARALVRDAFDALNATGAEQGSGKPETRAELENLLQLANFQTGGRLKVALRTVPGAELKAALLAFLEGREDLFEIYNEAIADFAK